MIATVRGGSSASHRNWANIAPKAGESADLRPRAPFPNRCLLSRALWLVALATFALSVDSAFASDYTWNVTGTGSWDIGINWSGGIPTISGTAVIDNSGTAVLGVGVSGTYDWLYTGSSSAGTIAIAGGHLTGLIGILGYGAGSMGSATVSSGTWSNSALAVGYSGTGVLNINGGYVSSGASYLGYGEGSMGTATVTSGTWINSYELYVGWSGKGILNVNGGYISNSEGIIGYSNGSSRETLI